MSISRTALAIALTGCSAACGTAPVQAAPASNTVPATNTSNAGLGNNYAERADVQQFVKQMSSKYNYSSDELLKAFGQAERMDTVLRQLERDKPDPNFKKNWTTYRARYIEPIRIAAGVKFWQANAATLSRASRDYGVPEYIIAGIIGVETIYGKYMGEHNVFDVLTTLAFDYPRRSAEYQAFLEEYIVLARENKMPLRSVKGSYAGAIGIPQFMPDSWRDYGVDFDGDGKVDLRNSNADAIGSVANFLKKKGGWQKGLDVIYSLSFNQKPVRIADALKLPIEPSKTLKELNEYGLDSPESIPADVKLSLIDLPNGDNPAQYVLGSRNFYAITRYNKSYMYAMSVYELGAAVKKAYDGAGKTSTTSAKPIAKPTAPAAAKPAAQPAAKPAATAKPVTKPATTPTSTKTNTTTAAAKPTASTTKPATTTTTKSTTTPTSKPVSKTTTSTVKSTATDAAKGVDPKNRTVKK